MLMSVPQRIADLPGDAYRILHIVGWVLMQGGSRDPLHDDKRNSGLLARIIDGDNVAMVELGHGLRFAQQAGPALTSKWGRSW